MSIHIGSTPHIPLYDNCDGVIWVPENKLRLAERICGQMEDEGFRFVSDWVRWQRGMEAEDRPESNPEYVFDQVWVCEDM